MVRERHEFNAVFESFTATINNLTIKTVYGVQHRTSLFFPTYGSFEWTFAGGVHLLGR